MNIPHTPEDAAILRRTDPSGATHFHDRVRDANHVGVWVGMRADYGRADGDFLSLVIATAGYEYRDQSDLIRSMRGAA